MSFFHVTIAVAFVRVVEINIMPQALGIRREFSHRLSCCNMLYTMSHLPTIQSTA